ncbi:Rieske (2Fe-2S) protein [Iodidimonas sp. SYSU 1G8]|uniref:Rieske (2Fe-2S) protein n=1 Tax=Iodidimonas sp. SYSU 1G8 TaxID=3133967 RepID=UPI0031FE850A
MSEEGTYFPVTKTTDIEQGKCKAFMVEGHDVLIARTKSDDFYAVENLCSHADATLESGRIRGNHIMCPLHGARFSLIDGSFGPPAWAPIKTYKLRVEGDQVEVLITGAPEKKVRGAMGMF